jgi:hypothetical protein
MFLLSASSESLYSRLSSPRADSPLSAHVRTIISVSVCSLQMIRRPDEHGLRRIAFMYFGNVMIRRHVSPEKMRNHLCYR